MPTAFLPSLLSAHPPPLICCLFLWIHLFWTFHTMAPYNTQSVVTSFFSSQHIFPGLPLWRFSVLHPIAWSSTAGALPGDPPVYGHLTEGQRLLPSAARAMLLPTFTGTLLGGRMFHFSRVDAQEYSCWSHREMLTFWRTAKLFSKSTSWLTQHASTSLLFQTNFLHECVHLSIVLLFCIQTLCRVITSVLFWIYYGKLAISLSQINSRGLLHFSRTAQH